MRRSTKKVLLVVGVGALAVGVVYLMRNRTSSAAPGTSPAAPSPTAPSTAPVAKTAETIAEAVGEAGK